jgi:hypothetical protein
MAEFALARTEGIADEIFFEALHLNLGRSGDFAARFSLKQMDKALRLALTADGLELPIAAALKMRTTNG